MSAVPTVAVTLGEPAGIGPDLCLRLAQRRWPARLVFVGDIELLRERALRAGSGARFVPYSSEAKAPSAALEVAHFPLAAAARPGEPDPLNARAVIATLQAALAGCMTGEFAAMVTAPIQKSAINSAGIPFTGHTEFLAERTGTRHVVMLLVGHGAAASLRVALATTHVPLSAVPAAITAARLTLTLRIVAAEMSAKFGIAKPKIAVCGLNPHAGESGYIGREEIDVIAPVIAQLRDEGIALIGPVPADTVFVPQTAKQFDCIVAMYHDQGLPALKQASFGHGVNVTLGLPIVRTSVDHGTALALAADATLAKTADPGSLIAATELAIELAAKARVANPDNVAG